MSADGRLVLLRLHQVDVSLVVTHLCQSARDVGLLEHLGGDEGGQVRGAGSDCTLLNRIVFVFVTSSSTRS